MDCSSDNSFAKADVPTTDGKAGAFSTTHWSVVLGVKQGDLDRSAAALEQLCRKYWYPIYAFVRRRGSDRHEAEDLTQAFFGHLLEKEALKKVDRQKGRFRTFLLAALTNFLNNEWDKRRTLKRGGQHQFISLDEAMAEERYRHEPVDPISPEKLFERRWAFALVEQVLDQIRQQYVAEGKGDVFALLECGLTRETNPGMYSEWAAALDMNESAVRVAMHRLRRRFGQQLRTEIAHTISSPAEIDDEIRYLFAALST